MTAEILLPRRDGTTERLALQLAVVQKAYLKSVPWAASRSWLGVLITLLP